MKLGCPMLAATATLLAACNASHIGDECSRDRACPSPLVCDLDPGADARRTCVPTCDRMVDGDLCDSGAVCLVMRCSAGGTVPEGGIAGARGLNDCAFGLVGSYDYAAEPLVRRCRRECESVDDCHADREEICGFGGCTPVCVSPFGTPCEAPAICTWYSRICVSPRRLARADCDGDGDLEEGSGDCYPEFQCDAAAIGGCTFVPEGEI